MIRLGCLIPLVLANSLRDPPIEIKHEPHEPIFAVAYTSRLPTADWSL